MTNKVKMTVEFELPQALLDALGVKATTSAKVEAKAAPVEKAAPAKKAAPKKEEPAEDEDEGGFGGGSDAGDDKSVEDVQVAMQRFAAQEGKPAALKMLKDDFGVSNISKLDQEQRNALVEQVEGLLE